MRSGTEAKREDRESMFYPVILDEETGAFVGVGQALALSDRRQDYSAPDGTVAVWPIRKDGSEGRWQVGPSAARNLRERGFLKVGRFKGEDTAISYLKAGEQKKLSARVFGETVLSDDGHVVTEGEAEGNLRVPTTQWALVAHSAADHGSSLLRKFLPRRKFPFPKSLYAVEDTLKFFLTSKPNALVLDFFSGSGTTAHAVMRLNRQDGGRRQCISVTNNEVSSDEQDALRNKGLRPGDQEWEALGICDFITKPRIEAAITGRAHDGVEVEGEYKFNDEFPMAEGLAANARFFTLTYETPISVSHNRAFSRIAPLLWLRAGATGREISTVPEAGWEVVDTYALLSDLDAEGAFLNALENAEGLRIAYIVTDDAGRFESVSSRLPEGIEPVRLYESYLTNLSFLSGD